ncbi:MAG: hypothetical protein K0A99_06665 [Desulfoarculaceae bacterium]|nr:hypothetical protein [Desulfoarculaceae bacterium]
MNHEAFLSDLVTSLPELNGAFLFSPQAEIIATHIGDSLSDFNPLAIGKRITDIATTASSHLHDINHLQVTFDNMILSGRLLPDQNWLFIIHTPELSTGMIRMTLQLALNNSAQESDTGDRQPEQSIPKMAAAEPAALNEAIKIDTGALMSPGAPLARPLNELQDALANCIGPAAIPVFQDILSAWCQEHKPALATLKHLIPLMDHEIEDREDLNSFHNNIKDLFPQE